MMRMKKLWTWILTAALMMGVMPLTYAAGSGSSSTEQEMISMLTDLGVIRSYQPDSFVALSDLSDTLKIITGGRNTVGQYFDSAAIRANRALKYSEILVVLVDITGYTPYLDLKYGGVNENGYIQLAAQLGITRGVNVRYNESINGADYARMLYNTLFVDMLQQTYYGKELQYGTEKGQNLLTIRMELTTVTGVVRAAGITSLDGEGWYSAPGEVQNIRIGTQNYCCGFNFLEEDIVGRTVEAYIHQETNTIAAVVVSEKDNNILHITGEDLENVPNVKNLDFSYMGKNGRTVKGRLSNTVDVVYNGALLPDFEAKHFTEGDTVITMVDNNLDKEYDVVLIDDYVSFVFRQISADGKTITDMEGSVYDFTQFVDRDFSFMDGNGESVSVAALQSGAIMSVRFDKDGQPNRVFVSQNRAQGVLQQINDGERSIVLDGTEYACAKRFYDSGKLKNIELGSGVTVYLDVWGRAAMAESYKSVRKLAWVFSAVYAEELDVGRLWMIDEDNWYGYVDTSHKLTFNQRRIMPEQLLSQPELLDATGTFKPQLVRLRKNSSGEITSIDTAVNKHEFGGVMSGEDVFELNYEYTGKEGHKTLQPYTVNNMKWLGTKYVATPDTLLFTINNADRRLSHVGTASSLPTDSGLKLNLYNVDKDYVPQAIVMTTADYSSTSYVYNYTQPYIVKEATHTLNDDGDIVLRLSVYKDEEIVTFDVENPDITAPQYNIIFYNWLDKNQQMQIKKLPICDIPRGSVIQVQTLPGTNIVRAFAILYIPGEEFEVPFFVDSTDTASNSYKWDDGYTFRGNGLSSYARVLQKTKYGVVINCPDIGHREEAGEKVWNRHILFSDSTIVYVADAYTGSIELGSWADIDVGNMLYLHRNNTTIKAAVVYK